MPAPVWGQCDEGMSEYMSHGDLCQYYVLEVLEVSGYLYGVYQLDGLLEL